MSGEREARLREKEKERTGERERMRGRWKREIRRVAGGAWW